MAYRFDEQFLVDRIKKQDEWISKGVKTGSGKAFTRVVRGVGAGGFPTNGNQSSKKRQSSKKKASDNGISPHAQALAALSKNQKLRTGGMVNGKKKAANHEHWEQVIFFDWLYRYQFDFYPDFAAVPNGGLRDRKTANDLYAEGVKSGYPDITADIAKGIYHGLFIELKYGNNKPSDNQITVLNRKRNNGYFCAVCYGWEEAKELVIEYLGLGKKGVMKWNKNEKLWWVDDDKLCC